MTTYTDVATDLRKHRPTHGRRSILDSVLSHLAEPPRAREEPQWIILITMIASEAADPWNDDEARGAMSAHARRSALSHARRAAQAHGRRRRR